MGEARAVKWKKWKKKSTSRLPPDNDSHILKVTRVNYQVYLFLNYDKPDAPPSPLNHGWTMKDGQCVPIRYTKPSLPPALRNLDTGTEGSDSDNESV